MLSPEITGIIKILRDEYPWANLLYTNIWVYEMCLLTMKAFNSTYAYPLCSKEKALLKIYFPLALDIELSQPIFFKKVSSSTSHKKIPSLFFIIITKLK